MCFSSHFFLPFCSPPGSCLLFSYWRALCPSCSPFSTAFLHLSHPRSFRPTFWVAFFSFPSSRLPLSPRFVVCPACTCGPYSLFRLPVSRCFPSLSFAAKGTFPAHLLLQFLLPSFFAVPGPARCFGCLPCLTEVYGAYRSRPCRAVRCLSCPSTYFPSGVCSWCPPPACFRTRHSSSWGFCRLGFCSFHFYHVLLCFSLPSPAFPSCALPGCSFDRLFLSWLFYPVLQRTSPSRFSFPCYWTHFPNSFCLSFLFSRCPFSALSLRPVFSSSAFRAIVCRSRFACVVFTCHPVPPFSASLVVSPASAIGPLSSCLCFPLPSCALLLLACLASFNAVTPPSSSPAPLPCSSGYILKTLCSACVSPPFSFCAVWATLSLPHCRFPRCLAPAPFALPCPFLLFAQPALAPRLPFTAFTLHSLFNAFLPPFPCVPFAASPFFARRLSSALRPVCYSRQLWRSARCSFFAAALSVRAALSLLLHPPPQSPTSRASLLVRVPLPPFCATVLAFSSSVTLAPFVCVTVSRRIAARSGFASPSPSRS